MPKIWGDNGPFSHPWLCLDVIIHILHESPFQTEFWSHSMLHIIFLHNVTIGST